MFRRTVKNYTLLVIILMSVIWFVIYVVYSECRGGKCTKSLTYVMKINMSGYFEGFQDRGNKKEMKLKKWRSVPMVLPSRENFGEWGKPVYIPHEKMVEMKEKFKLHEFNVMVSDMISVNRSLLDVRHESCKKKFYPKWLPNTSVVIVFHNEAWSVLLRTVWSVINRSPRTLLKEIILVDDKSEMDYLGKKLENYMKKLPVPVFVLRMKNRSGLVQARLFGAKRARGQVITFLDAHSECTQGWLEPLLARIVENRKTVVCPIIDTISDKTFKHLPASDKTWGGYDWRLNFRWHKIPQREINRRGNDKTAPLKTPTIAGGLFSVERDYFFQVGSYDEGMKIWGAENLEISFRVWMCGGTLEIIPCSHVGHIYRKFSPYTFPGGISRIINYNKARLVEVWLDDWKHFYYKVNPVVKKTLAGDISARKALRNKLNCKSFKWYLENVYPESPIPLHYYYLGNIKNTNTKWCLDTTNGKSNKNLGISYCHNLGGNQIFVYTNQKQIMSNEHCLDAPSIHQPIKLTRCHPMGDSQTWYYDPKNNTIKHIKTGFCLQKTYSGKKNLPLLRECNNKLDQQWIMSNEKI